MDLELSTVEQPHGLVDLSRVRAAGVLLLGYHYGTRMRFFDAVGRAIDQLDADKLCLDFTRDRKLLDALNCWPALAERLSPTQLAHMVARVFGIPSPDVAEDDRNTAIRPKLGQLLDALNAFCNPDACRQDPTSVQVQQLWSALRAVRANLSWSMSGWVMLRVRQMEVNLDFAKWILDQLAGHLSAPCYVGHEPGLWGALITLVGDDLRADGVELTEAAEIAEAWKVIFDWLTDDTASSERPVSNRDVLCAAAATLRPTANGAPSSPQQ